MICAYSNGPLLRDVLLAAAVSKQLIEGHRSGLPSPAQMTQAKGSMRLASAFSMAWILEMMYRAQFMNDEPMPPDYDHPVRVTIPGHIGGRWYVSFVAMPFPQPKS